MGKGKVSRRGFLSATLGTAVGGMALAGLPTARAANSRGASSVFQAGPSGKFAVSTHEHYGDLTEDLWLPPSWDTRVYHMEGNTAPVLSPEEIRAKIQKPIGTKPLRELAAGKQNAVITFDDLSRPTPTFRILPIVIEELKAAGIPEERILLLTSYGSHQPMHASEVSRKLGVNLAGRFPWANHNIWEQVTEVGTTSRGNVIKINHHFARADLRVCISGIKIHGTAGFGGGAKAVLPGICWAESIDFIHRTIAGVGQNHNRTVGAAKIYTNECRKDMEEAAQLARVDFTVQTLYNGRREVTGIFAGDVIESHRVACHSAIRHYRTEQAEGADVVIINAYPQNAQAFNGLGWARRGLRDGGSVVLITQYSPGLESLHYMGERWRYEHALFWDAKGRRLSPLENSSQFIVYTGTMQQRDRTRFPGGTRFAAQWQEVVERLQKQHRGDLRVAVYPYAPIQHPPLVLDGPLPPGAA